MKNIISILVILFGILNTQTVFANSQFEEANKLYSEKNYVEALDKYIHILESGEVSANLYYNIGNCYYKLDSLNKAILFYEKSKKLNPNDKDVAHNLELINRTYVDEIEEVPTLFLYKWNQALIKLFPKGVWTIISLVFFVLLLISVVLVFISTARLKRIGLSAAIISLIFTIFTSIYAAREYNYQTKNNSAIIFTPTLNVKSSPDAESTNLFVIHQGTKVHIVDKIGDWYHIKIKDGNQGWVRVENFRFI